MKAKIDKFDLTNNKQIIYNNSKFVYIPLISGNDTDITILVKKDEYVYKGSIVGKRKGELRIPIFSSVSGKVLGFENKYICNGLKVRCVVIENDFKEKIANKIVVKHTISKYTKEEFIIKLRECGIVGLGGACFPTYVKYEKNINLLIVNAIESEPFITSDQFIAMNKCEEILETIDAILEINNIDKAIIVIRNDSPLKLILNNFIGTYLKIKIKVVPNNFSLGYERLLVKKLTGKDYNISPIEKGIVVNNISTIYAIYEALKYNKPLIDRIVTFSGDNILNKVNVLVKVGTPIKEILKELKIKDNSVIIAGGPIMGKELDDFVVTPNLNGVIILERKKIIEYPCNNCGKCVSVCPMNLSPVLIMKSKSKKELNELHVDQCIECGLCSYICPSKILVREKIKEVKNNGTIFKK